MIVTTVTTAVIPVKGSTARQVPFMSIFPMMRYRTISSRRRGGSCVKEDVLTFLGEINSKPGTFNNVSIQPVDDIATIHVPFLRSRVSYESIFAVCMNTFVIFPTLDVDVIGRIDCREDTVQVLHG